jgi:hypothetical protein
MISDGRREKEKIVTLRRFFAIAEAQGMNERDTQIDWEREGEREGEKRTRGLQGRFHSETQHPFRSDLLSSMGEAVVGTHNTATGGRLYEADTK